MTEIAYAKETAPEGSVFIPARTNAVASPQIRCGQAWIPCSPRRARRIARVRAGEGAADICLNAAEGGVITPLGEVFFA